MEIITIVIGMLLIPLIYGGVMWVYRSEYEKDDHRSRRPLSTWQEWLVLLTAELALLRMWFASGCCSAANLSFSLIWLSIMLMTLVCITDYTEQIVPNSFLLTALLMAIILFGYHLMMGNVEVFYLLPSVLLGFLFALLVFGMGYVLSRGSMGAGDVKLALLLGITLTGEYIVSTVLMGCLVSAGYALVQIGRKKMTKKSAMPFVPFLYIGMIITFFLG